MHFTMVRAADEKDIMSYNYELHDMEIFGGECCILESNGWGGGGLVSKPASLCACSRASSQASKQAYKQASERETEPASLHTRKRVNERASEQASEQAS